MFNSTSGRLRKRQSEPFPSSAGKRSLQTRENAQKYRSNTDSTPHRPEHSSRSRNCQRASIRVNSRSRVSSAYLHASGLSRRGMNRATARASSPPFPAFPARPVFVINPAGEQTRQTMRTEQQQRRFPPGIRKQDVANNAYACLRTRRARA